MCDMLRTKPPPHRLPLLKGKVDLSACSVCLPPIPETEMSPESVFLRRGVGLILRPLLLRPGETCG